MTKTSQLTQYLEFIRYSLNPDGQPIPDVKKLDWNGLYQFANEQAIAGVLFEGVKRLSEQGMKPPFDVLMQWIATAERIDCQNRKLNKECCRLTQLFESDGYKSVILKGQGNAKLYPNPFCRHSGDIDIYVEGGKQKVINLLKSHGMVDKLSKYENDKIASIAYHHIHIPSNEKGIVIEVHFLPSQGLYDPFINTRLQKLLSEEVMIGMKNIDEGFYVPSCRFSLLMQLAHIKRHYFESGIGLRQVIDFYYLLKSAQNEDRIFVSEKLKTVGLHSIAEAMMWVLINALKIETNKVILLPNERKGKMLFSSIIKGGNFGQYTERPSSGILRTISKRIERGKKISFDPNEALWMEIRDLFYVVQTIPERIRRRSFHLSIR